MTGKELTEKLKELNQVSEITCTDTELQEYENYGLLIKSGDKYITRNGKTIKIDLIKTKSFRLTIDLSDLIANCEQIAKTENIKRIYCMSESTYNKYKEQQLIVTKSNIDYYRLYENELWRVYLI